MRQIQTINMTENYLGVYEAPNGEKLVLEPFRELREWIEEMEDGIPSMETSRKLLRAIEAMPTLIERQAWIGFVQTVVDCWRGEAEIAAADSN